MKAPRTRSTTNANQIPNAIEKDLPRLSLRGLVQANPISSKTSVQIAKTSTDLPNARSHLGESSGRNAAMFAAIGFSRSTLPYGFKYKIKIRRGLLTRLVR